MSNHAPKVDPIAKIVFILSALAIVTAVYILVSSLISTYQRNSTKGEIDSTHLTLNAEENLKPIGVSSTSDAPAVSSAEEKKESPKKDDEAKSEEKPELAVEPTPVKASESNPAPVAAAPAAPSIDGKEIYDASCFACHASGVAGSPKLGDKEAWSARIATGIESLYTIAIQGKGAMPPKGGNMALADDKVKAAVDYMVNQSK